MFEVTKHFEFTYAHRLFGYDGPCKHIHGHTAKVEITCSKSDLAGLGMVVDFGVLKDKVGSWIEKNLDHRLLLFKDDPIAIKLSEDSDEVGLKLLETQPTAENIAKLIYDNTESLSLGIIKVTVWESPTSFAVYSN